METFRTKRSKICVTRRSSGHSLFHQGDRQVLNQRNCTNWVFDSGTYNSGASENSLMFDLGRKSSKQVSGTPMKKLLAKEMLQETECKRRPPSVIARLMGFEGLPSQRHDHEQHAKPSEYHRHVMTLKRPERTEISYSHRSSRKSSKEEEEFKDVFEVLDISKYDERGSSYSSQGSIRSHITESDMAFIRQKFMDAKRLSTDDELQDSKEFHDTLEVLDSNKDLLLKFLQQPDSLFSMHLQDLKGSPSNSHCSMISAVKSSSDSHYEHKFISANSGRRNLLKNSGKHCNMFRGHSHSRSLDDSVSRKIEERIRYDTPPTRIVVLKPNLGKVNLNSNSVFSPTSLPARSDQSNYDDSQGCRFGNPGLLTKSNHSANVDSRLKSQESREVAKEITRRMKNNYGTSSMNGLALNFRGYAGDESSSTLSGSDSAYESDANTIASKRSCDFNMRSRAAPRSNESSVSREAKKRLSERWKMTHRSQEIEIVNKGSTLADMLALPDRDPEQANFDYKVGQPGFPHKFVSNGASIGRFEPLGISSRDGWKDICINRLSRSRSLPSSSIMPVISKTSIRHEPSCHYSYMMAREPMRCERHKMVKNNCDLRGGVLPRRLKSRRVKRQFTHDSSGDSSDDSLEIHDLRSRMKTGIKEINLSQDLFASEASYSTIHDDLGKADSETICLSSEPSKSEQTPVQFSDKVDPPANGPDNITVQEPSDGTSKESPVPFRQPVAEFESPASSKEVEQPSPVSILEAPFTDDLSSGSECFESLSADLQGLRMQLQLLKLESKAYAEGALALSSDEEVDGGSFDLLEVTGMLGAEESWECSYMVDVLTNFGHHISDPDSFVMKWHSSECPFDPSIFEELEKKYCSQSSTRGERKLLFDRINSGLLEMYQVMDPHPWVRSVVATPRLRWDKENVLEGLRKSLTSQEKKASKASEKVVECQSQWLNLGDDIDHIGREIEGLLIMELFGELVSM